MKSLIATICILGLVGMAVGVAVQAQEEASVAATVTPQNISVTVTPGSVNYGVLAVSTSDASRTTALSGAFTATNNGNVSENFLIRGSNSTTWALNFAPATTGTVGANQFVHRFDADATFTDATANALSLTNQTLGGPIGVSGTQQFELQMNMPTSSTNIDAEESTTVTVVATL